MKTHWLSPSLAISPLALSLILAQSVAAPAATSATDSTTPPTSTPAAAQAPVNPVATAPAEVPKPPALSPGVADVARLNAGGVSPQVILEFIRQTREKYRLTADDILYLNQSRVPPEIVASMMQKHATIDAQAAAVVPQQPPAAPQAPVAIPAPPLSPPVV
ncbi:MAG: hypothetical protein HYR88_02220, partial [Verrucomicrobia bacterium]|nr:hypothetical protein [Verrucomicrobiota bacterium]